MLHTGDSPFGIDELERPSPIVIGYSQYPIIDTPKKNK
jgi:hypothetical protein